METNQINYLLTNVDNIKWKPENYEKFISFLTSMDLSVLNPTLQQKAKELLQRPREPQNISIDQNVQPEVQNIVNQSNNVQNNNPKTTNNVSKIIAVIGVLLMGASLILPSLDIGGVSKNISSVLYVVCGLIVCFGVLTDNGPMKKVVFILVVSEVYSFFTISDYLNEFQFVKIGLGIISEFVGAILITVSAITSSLSINRVNSSGIKYQISSQQ